MFTHTLEKRLVNYALLSKVKDFSRSQVVRYTANW